MTADRAMPMPYYRLAPRPTTVDGILAVPVHFQDVQATVTFDSADSTGRPDVTATYEVGPTAGSSVRPAADDRPSLGRRSARRPGRLEARDVGAGTFSTVPVLDAVQTAVSVHRLRVAYWLETPDFQLGGSYPPVVTWSPGPGCGGPSVHRRLWRSLKR